MGVILLLLLLLESQAFAGTQNVSISIGDQSINIPAPEGFYEVSHLSEEVRKIGETFIPPDNRLLAIFVSGKNFGRLMKDEWNWVRDYSGLGDKYMIVQGYRKDENKNVQKLEFEAFKEHIKQQHNIVYEKIKDRVDVIIKKGVEQISQEYDVSLDLKVDTPVPLGVFMDKTDVIGFASLMKGQALLNGTSVSRLVVVGTSFLKMQGKILFVYVYSNFDTSEDLDWVRTASSTWVDQIFLKNEMKSISQKPSIGQSTYLPIENGENLTGKGENEREADSIIAMLNSDQGGSFLLLSAILTWGIGLTPPLFIRFLLLRRPVEKQYALAIVCLFWLFNLLLFTALGSKSKTHFGLFLVAWASYWILRKKTIPTVQISDAPRPKGGAS